MVIMPDYLHCIWTLPPKDADLLRRKHDIIARFAGQIARVERFSEAKGGMRFAFPPYGPTALMGV